MTDETPARRGAAPVPVRWSVVVPTHDCAGFLARTLQEVVRQLGHRDDVEILVVDDASSDDPAAVVAAHGAGRVRFEPNPQWLGAIGTFNRCLALARGELVHLLHGDDAVLPGFYAAMESAFDDPDVAAAVCRVRDVDADDATLYETRSYRHGTGTWADALDLEAVSNRVRTPGIVVARRTYERVGGYRADFPHAADWEMWVRVAASGPVVFVDEVLACYRRHAGSDTSARLLSGANTRERRVVLATLMEHVPARDRARLGRSALLHTAYFAGRTGADLARRGEPRAALRQLREAATCLLGLPRGIRLPEAPSSAPPVPPVQELSAR